MGVRFKDDESLNDVKFFKIDDAPSAPGLTYDELIQY